MRKETRLFLNDQPVDMKKLLRYLLLFLFAAFQFPVSAQDSTAPKAHWTFAIEKISTSKYKIIAKANIEPGWGLFSVTMPDDMPNTRFSVDTGSNFIITSIVEKGKRIDEKNLLLDAAVSYFKNNVEIEITGEIKSGGGDVKGSLSYMTYKGEEFTNPVSVPLRFVKDGSGNLVFKSSALAEANAGSFSLKRKNIDLNNPVVKFGGTGAEGSKSLWRVFLLGILGGLVGLVMPCTFPMIPMTVSFFTKKSGDKQKGIRNAFLYGFFIFLIYILLSVPFYFLESGNSDILNNISTNAWLNIFFALIFFLFALSFFGLFEIGLPGNVANKVDSRSNIGSLGGIFFMALTLAIVSFSCTGPILGTLLVGALNNDGGAFQLTVAMAGFGLALGLPFGLFALFPRWLSSLPRSGSWMNTVKIVFAFIELALMVKFLSNADLVMHWGLLKREVFFGIWILIGLATVLYLFGILKFKHDPPPAKLGKGRIATALLFLAFVIYLIPGLTNTRHANRSLISGFPPPLSYSVYGHESAKGKGVEADIVNDYEKAIALAKEKNKPLLIDFTGWACVNCRKMEENVWTQPEIKDLIEKNFVLVSLYVDDRQKLKEEEQFLYTTGDGAKKAIRTIGDKFITLQSENFKNASQPLYAIIDANERLMNLPVGYTPNASDYAEWLKSGLEAFGKGSEK